MRRKNKSLIKKSGGGKYTYYLYHHKNDYSDDSKFYLFYTRAVETSANTTSEYEQLKKNKYIIKKFIIDKNEDLDSDNKPNIHSGAIKKGTNEQPNCFLYMKNAESEIKKFEIEGFKLEQMEKRQQLNHIMYRLLGYVYKVTDTFTSKLIWIFNNECTLYEIDYKIIKIFNNINSENKINSNQINMLYPPYRDIVEKYLIPYITRNFSYDENYDNGTCDWKKNKINYYHLNKTNEISGEDVFFMKTDSKKKIYAIIFIFQSESIPEYFDHQKVKTFEKLKLNYQLKEFINRGVELHHFFENQKQNTLENLQFYLKEDFNPKVFSLSAYLIKSKNEIAENTLPDEYEVIDTKNMNKKISWIDFQRFSSIPFNLGYHYTNQKFIDSLSTPKKTMTIKKVKEILGNFK